MKIYVETTDGKERLRLTEHFSGMGDKVEIDILSESSEPDRPGPTASSVVVYKSTLLRAADMLSAPLPTIDPLDET